MFFEGSLSRVGKTTKSKLSELSKVCSSLTSLDMPRASRPKSAEMVLASHLWISSGQGKMMVPELKQLHYHGFVNIVNSHHDLKIDLKLFLCFLTIGCCEPKAIISTRDQRD